MVIFRFLLAFGLEDTHVPTFWLLLYRFSFGLHGIAVAVDGVSAVSPPLSSRIRPALISFLLGRSRLANDRNFGLPTVRCCQQHSRATLRVDMGCYLGAC